MPQKASEFATVRLPISLKRKVALIGRLNRWSLSKSLCILVEEAVAQREHAARQSEIAAGVMEQYAKGKLAEAEGLR